MIRKTILKVKNNLKGKGAITVSHLLQNAIILSADTKKGKLKIIGT